jgi:GTP-binding protein
MFIDEVSIAIGGGHGGKGAVAFDKNKMALGPAGGSGGKGGSVYAEGVADIGALRQFRFQKEFLAENGEPGRGQFRDGHTGKDILLKVPVGTVVHNLTTGKDIEITNIGERIMLAAGGIGGKGNFQFRSPRNTSPEQFQSGRPGERFDVRLELKLIADVGFVGLPNVGKSSLLNALTKAGVKVANYQFTTLEPNLGSYYGLILADIPGLIEEASEGRGLGIKFLRHIERTKVLFHFVAADAEDPLKDYSVVKNELGKYNPELLEKEEHIFISRADLRSTEQLKDIVAAFKKKKLVAQSMSIKSPKGLEPVHKILRRLEAEKFGPAAK